jgi:hypothetical protein
MSSFVLLRASLLPVFMRAGRVGLSLFALSPGPLGCGSHPCCVGCGQGSASPAGQIEANGLAQRIGKGLIIMSPQVPLGAEPTVPAA